MRRKRSQQEVTVAGLQLRIVRLNGVIKTLEKKGVDTDAVATALRDYYLKSSAEVPETPKKPPKPSVR